MSDYIGRFAPSPTGLLHMGSLLAALASFLDARANGGRWLVRMEDLDPPREQPGAAQAILDSLRAHGLHWDGEVMWQSQRGVAYDDALEQLLASGKAYYCSCSRSDLALYRGIYPGSCRGCRERPQPPSAIRLQVAPERIEFVDGLQGRCGQQLESKVGDFVLKRKDGLYAYQLAVVVDDAEQGVTHVVRGSDLLDSTPRQIWLQRCLGLPTPHYIHIPVLVNRQGQKLSKQTFAPAIDRDRAIANLLVALSYLRQPAPTDTTSVDTVLQQAIVNWSLQLIPSCPALEPLSVPDC